MEWDSPPFYGRRSGQCQGRRLALSEEGVDFFFGRFLRGGFLFLTKQFLFRHNLPQFYFCDGEIIGKGEPEIKHFGKCLPIYRVKALSGYRYPIPDKKPPMVTEVIGVLPALVFFGFSGVVEVDEQ